MKYTIEDLRNGKCAVINDGTLEELIEVLRLAFSEHEPNCIGSGKFYLTYSGLGWSGSNQTNLPTQSVKDFLKPSLDDKIKELKELAKSQGMDCDVVLSDSWEGVEFAECLSDKSPSYFTLGKIYQINTIYGDEYKRLEVKRDDTLIINGIPLESFKPSTEKAYIEQLKKECFERFGEISEGMKFDTGYGVHSIYKNYPEWYYNKNIDFLYYKGLIVYSKGEWSKKLQEKKDHTVFFDGFETGYHPNLATISFIVNHLYNREVYYDLALVMKKYLDENH